MAKATKTKKVAEPVATIQIDRIASETILIPIIGTTELIMHRMGPKIRKIMLDAMQGVKTPKKNKDPEAEYQECFYRFEDGGYGFPSNAFKLCTVGGARFYPKSAVTMTGLKQFMFFGGEVGVDGQLLCRIEGSPYMREDPVTVGRGGKDLRYRPGFPGWSTVLKVTYVTSALTRGSLLSLIDAGGMGVGVGDWRNEKGGEFGSFCVDDSKEIKVVS